MNKNAWQWMITPLQNYANFSGRAPRAEFWWFFLFQLLVSLIPLVGTLAALAFLIPSLAVTVRRFHDIGRSGWWYLLPVAVGIAMLTLLFAMAGANALANPGALSNIAFGGVGLVAVLVFMGVLVLQLVWLCTPSQPFGNKWGPNPYGPQDVAQDFA